MGEKYVDGLLHLQQLFDFELPDVVCTSHGARVIGKTLEVALQGRQGKVRSLSPIQSNPLESEAVVSLTQL